jgi:hypothetical protein
MSDPLPNTREMPKPGSQSVMLGSVGSALRAQYDELRRGTSWLRGNTGELVRLVSVLPASGGHDR